MQEAAAKQLEYAPSTPTVLVVDDDPVSSMLVQRYVHALGYPVDIAPNGLVALEMHRAKQYRFIVSDWMMPGMSGIDLCREIRQSQTTYAYFVLLTAKGLREAKLQAFEAGVDDFLTKPIDRDELFARLSVAKRIFKFEDAVAAKALQLEESNSKIQNANDGLRLALWRFGQLFNGLPVACFTFDRDGLVREWNRAAEDAFGIRGFEAIETPLQEVFATNGGGHWSPEKLAQIFDQTRKTFEWEYMCPDESQKYFACNLITLPNSQGEPVGAVCASLDITERRIAELLVEEQNSILAQQHEHLAELNRRLDELAKTDGLTGLLNHREFQSQLSRVALAHSRERRPFSLLLLDVDRFKLLNDEFGHQVGDAVLKQVAAVIQSKARKHETTARYGGEEFAILLENCEGTKAVLAAERFRKAIAASEWTHRQVTASFGVATWYPEDEDVTPQEVVRMADEALYASKEGGRNRVTHSNTLERLVA